MGFEECLRQKKLVETKIEISLIKNEAEEAEKDLFSAQDDFKKKDWKWATTKAYYSMFHAAKSLLYAKGFKERKSHFCLIEGIREFYIHRGLLPLRFVEYLEAGKIRREDATYELVYSEEIAQTYIHTAAEFLQEAKKIIKGLNL